MATTEERINEIEKDMKRLISIISQTQSTIIYIKNMLEYTVSSIGYVPYVPEQPEGVKVQKEINKNNKRSTDISDYIKW